MTGDLARQKDSSPTPPVSDDGLKKEASDERSIDSPLLQSAASRWRAWCYLIQLSWLRQARAHLMVLIALALLGLTVLVVAINHGADRWEGDKGFILFSRFVVISVLSGFLLPIWTIGFATEALGRERESQNLVWVLTRPLSRPAIFLGKFLAALPWCLLFNVGGFALICLAAGDTGQEAFAVFWPAIVLASFTYGALFHLLGAWFRRAAVIALLYTFFLESFMGSLPGYWKRTSIAFYTRCLIFDAGEEYGLRPLNPDVFIPVEAGTAWMMQIAATILFLAVGMIVFTRSEYLDLN